MSNTNDKKNVEHSILDGLVCQLVEDGWEERPNRLEATARCFFKRFDTPTCCACNEDKRGMQVQINLWSDSVNYEMKLAGELKDGTWIQFHQWNLPDEIKDGIALIPRLLQTWEFMVNDRGELRLKEENND